MRSSRDARAARRAQATRAQRAKSTIVDALHGWLHEHVGRVSAASDLATAIRYAIRHWPGLVMFLDDGRIEIDTTWSSERSGRVF